MADIQNLTVTPNAAAQNTIPTHTIACQVTDSNTGAVLADFSGANAIVWPTVLATLSAAQRQQIIQSVLNTIVRMKAGLQ